MKDDLSQENTSFSIKDNSSLHNYRTEIPNIIFELGLDPFALSLYLYYKKVAGDKGTCFQKKSTIEENTKMSRSVIKDRNNILSSPFPELGGKPLIKITQRKAEDGGTLPSLIEIIDIWPDNFKILSTRFLENHPPAVKKPPPSRQKTTEEDPLQEDPNKKLFVAEPPVGAPPHKISIKTGNGKQEIAIDQIFLLAIKNKCDWKTTEIEEAWKVLADYKGVVHDWWRFIEGTIEKKRNTNKSKYASQQGEKACRKEKTQKNCKNTSSEKDTSEPISSESNPCLGTLLKNYRDGLKNQKDSSTCSDHQERAKHT